MNPKTELYYIGPLVKLQWMDYSGGIVDKTYWGTPYCSGTCIILSHALVDNIVANRDNTTFVENLSITKLPTSSKGLPKNSIWNNNGVLSVV